MSSGLLAAAAGSSSSPAPLSFAERLASAAPAGTSNAAGKHRGKAQPNRVNKNRPQEITSKRQVKRFRVASGLSADDPSKKEVRDPRFDPLAADEPDSHAWRTKYAFVAELRRKEAEEIQQRLDRSAAASQKRGRSGAQRQRLREERLAPEEEQQLKDTLGRMQNQLRAHDQMQERQSAKSAARKQEVAAIQQGKRPYFAKPAVLKEQALVSQYEQLRSSGQLEKFMAKKRQRTAAKVHRLIPRGRRGEEE